MESILSNFDIENPKNFWKLYPSFKTPALYLAFYKADKSKGKTKSSLIMWGLMHIYDKTELNPYKSLDTEDRIDIINEDLLNDPGYNWDKHADLMDLTSRLLQSEEERMLYSFEAYLEKRRKFIDKTQQELTFTNIKDLDSIIKRNDDNMKELKRLRDFVEHKGDKARMRGDIVLSALEEGLI